MTLCGRMAFKTINKNAQQILEILENGAFTELDLRISLNKKGVLYRTLKHMMENQYITREKREHRYYYFSCFNLTKLKILHNAIYTYRRYKYNQQQKVKKRYSEKYQFKRSRNVRFLRFALEYIQNHRFFRTRDIARAYLKKYPEMNGYKNHEQENIKYITNVLGGYWIYFKIKKYSTYAIEVTSELIEQIRDFLTSEKKPSLHREEMVSYLTKDEFKQLCREGLDDQISFLGANKPDYHFKQLYNEVCCND